MSDRTAQRGQSPPTGDEPALSGRAALDLPRRVGFIGAVAVMLGVIIGSGIFRTPAEIANHLDHPGWILGFWTLGGLIALAGALTFAELAVLFPRSGGVYVFIREAFGPAAAFVFGWTYLLLVKPAAAGGIAIIFAEHLNTLLKTEADPRLLTVAVLCVLTWINVRGVRLSTAFTVVLTGLKVFALLAIIALGLSLGRFQPDLLRPQHGAVPLSVLAAIAPVMAGVLWTYDGWSDVGAIAGEVTDPQRTLPRVYLFGTGLITVLYVAVNAVYMGLVPLEQMRASQAVGPLVMDRIMGSGGASVIALVVLVSTMGSTHASIMTGGRVTYAQARDGLLFAPLARIHPRYATPHVSLWVQLALSCIAIVWLGTFSRLAETFTFTMWIFYGLAGAAIFVLRFTRPDLPRVYRCWGYPLVPALFVLAAVGMTGLSIWSDPAQTLPRIGVLIAGLPVYLVWNRLRRRPGGASN